MLNCESVSSMYPINAMRQFAKAHRSFQQDFLEKIGDKYSMHTGRGYQTKVIEAQFVT